MSTLHVYLNWVETWARWAPSNYSGEAREPRGAHSAVHYRDFDVIYTVSNQTTHARVYGLKFPPVARQYLGDCDGSTGSFRGLASKFDVYAVYWDSRHSKRYDDNVSLRLITHEYVPSAADDAHIYCAFNVETGYWLKELGRYLPARHHTTDPTTVVSGGRLLSCKVPVSVYRSGSRKPPCSVHLSPSQHQSWVTTPSFRIIDTASVRSPRDFTVCVTPLYGDIPQAHIMEFMELTRLLGACHVTFYDYDLSAQALKLVRYYARSNRATLLTWRPRFVVNESAWNIGVKAAMTDCLYRNMALSRYVVFMDLNEYIVPYKWTSWQDMLQELDTKNTCAFTVEGAFFDPYFQDSPVDVGSVVENRTLSNTWRTWTTSRQFARSIVKPEMIFKPGSSGYDWPFAEGCRVQAIGYPDALTHHHQVCPAAADMNCDDMVTDDVVPARYSSALETLLRKRKRGWSRYKGEL